MIRTNLDWLRFTYVFCEAGTDDIAEQVYACAAARVSR
jgi:hypothetical protein